MRNCVEPGADRVTPTEKLFAPCSAHLRVQCVITVRGSSTVLCVLTFDLFATFGRCESTVWCASAS